MDDQPTLPPPPDPPRLRVLPLIRLRQQNAAWDDVPPPDGYAQDDDPEPVTENRDAPAPYWTFARLFYMLVLIITLLAFLAYTLAPLIASLTQPAPPPPIFGPRDRI
jgi:hypothetical protein